MNADNTCCSRRYHLLNLDWIDVMGARPNVAKHWRNLLPLQGMGSSHEGKGWQNHFAGKPKSTGSNFQGDSPIAHSDAMLDLQKISETCLQFSDKHAVIR